MIVYIAGPVTGLPNNNREAFFARERELLESYKDEKTLKIINPAKIGILIDYENMARTRVPSWEYYMRACIKELCGATHITYLSGWQKSKGAKLEKMIAERLGIVELVAPSPAGSDGAGGEECITF
jgi:hypothetical protein